MTTWSRRKWLLSGTALSAGLLAGTLPPGRAHAQVFTLSPDWKWEERRVAGEPPPTGHSVNLVMLPVEHAAVVGGPSPDVWLLDLRRWRWSRVASEAPPPGPRKDGAAWATKKGFYVAWGQEADLPAELVRHTFVCRSLVS